MLAPRDGVNTVTWSVSAYVAISIVARLVVASSISP